MVHLHPMDAVERRDWVAAQACELGFDLCGVAPVEGLDELAHLPEWLARGYAGEMKYLHDPRRASPESVVEGARSLIVCALNYNTSPPYSTQTPQSPADIKKGDPRGEREGPRGWISRYAWGEDYHTVLGEKLEALLERMRAQFAEPFEARAYVDTGPIVERVAARHAGLGWLAKNTCLINEQLGSWLFLGVIITTLDLAPSLGLAEAPPPDLCGNCTLCIDACPTGAIVEPYVLDARRCISYLTIELRGSIPEELRVPMGRHVFGCDICQDVCPWNRKAAVTALAAFEPRAIGVKDESRKSELETRERNGPTRRSLFCPDLEWLASLIEEEFRELFPESAIKRTKWRGLVRNACVALGNSAAALAGAPATHQRVVAQLERLAASDDLVIAEHARWALERIATG